MFAILALGAVAPGGGLGRRQLVGSALLGAARLATPPAGAAEEEMRTSANINGYKGLTGEPGSSLGAGAMSGKSRPRTGVCLIEPVITVGSSGAGKLLAVQSLVALDGGVAATTRFDSPYPLAVGFYYDVEVRSRESDGAFLQVERLPAGATFASVDPSWYFQTVLASSGRFGAYGTPTDVRLVADMFTPLPQPAGAGPKKTPKRVLEMSFSALTPGGSEQRRHAIISAVQPAGSDDAMLLVGGTTELRWRKGGTAAALRGMADSFELDRTRATKIPRTIKSDYRVAEGTLFP